ncbi:hypothetical protein [Flagellimonas algicola]|uniref:Lipocalin-like protein n=1 Tax=Flagellimonas algicola TaxID=2583815 RepID=A0ABY2WQA3_9FLAO|nr:hypothetical protein [Allomuricauda algicola]TMU57098.1 hypothetical protein FGG15_05995 [Allomuricauda algicola]
MRWTILFLLGLIFFGCAESSISKEELRHLNGYWEISNVMFPDGEQKDYGINPAIDFIHLEGSQGYRKKMQPKFDGSYQTSNQSEAFEVIQSQEYFVLTYKHNLDDRQETLIQLDSLSFIIRDEEGVQYIYKRFQPISIPK